ncbi:MAG TPA: purine-nucleoside phosphorylase [Acidimicrobiia bacterium]|nr:purine-nucleoside phosphorylase [Acidimicrobiia bacterium]
MTYGEIQAATTTIAETTDRERHSLAIVLGSGLGDYAGGLPGAVAVPYEDIPGFPVPEVEGHAGTLYSAELDDEPVMVLAGRVHTYEGWDLADVVFAVRTAVASGCRTIVLTNAAGGVGEDLEAGDLVLISDHLNLTARNPLTGANDSRLGPRFPDMTAVYPQRLRTMAKVAGERVGVPLKEGVYAWFLGPSYETPAEVQMAKRMGADLVGMSTVPEAIAARHMGADVLGISLVTNLAAGISPTPLSHEEVTETAAAARGRFTRLLDALLPELARAPRAPANG